MATEVAIKIRVDDGNVADTMNRIEQSLTGAGVQGEASFRKLGTAGADAGEKIGQGMRTAGGHLTTSLDGVRLLSQEFGLRIPRALETMLSRIPAVSAALSGLVGGFALIAGAEVFARVGEEAYHFYERLTDVNSEMKKYLAQAGKSANDRLFDTASLETSVDLLGQANDQIAALEAKRQRAGVGADGSGSVKQYAKYPIQGGAYLLDQGYRSVAEAITPEQLTSAGISLTSGAAVEAPATYGPKDDAFLAEAYANRDRSQSRANDLGRANDLDQLKERDAAATAGLLGYNQAASQLRGALAEAKATQDNVLASERDLATTTKAIHDAQIKAGMDPNDPKLTAIHQVDPNAGLAARQLAEQKARDEFTAKSIELARKERDERIAAQNEAINSGLEGEARYSAIRTEAIDALTRKYQDGELTMAGLRAMRAATEEKFDNEAADRQQKQYEDAQRMLRDASAAGLTGSARILAEQGNKIDDINSNRTLNPEAAAVQRQAVAAETNQKLNELDQNFTDHANELAMERTAAALGAYGRIDAEATSALNKLKKDYDEDISAYEDGSARKIAATQAYNDAVAAINADAAEKKKQQTERNAAEDLQYDREAQAAVSKVRQEGMGGWVSGHQQAVREIQLQEQERLAKLQEDAQKEGLTAEEVAKRRVDIETQANAEISAQNQQLQHQLAGALQSAFDDPLRYIKQQGEKMMFELVASWLLQMKVFKDAANGTFFGLHLRGGAGTGVAGAAGGAAAVGATAANTVGAKSGGGILGTIFPGLAQTAVLHGGSTASAASSPGAMPGGEPQSGTGATVAYSSGAGTVTDAGGGYSGAYSGTTASPSVVFPNGAASAGSAVSYPGRTSEDVQGDVSSGISDASSLARMFGVPSQRSSQLFFKGSGDASDDAAGAGLSSTGSDAAVDAGGGDPVDNGTLSDDTSGAAAAGTGGGAAALGQGLGLVSTGMAAYAGTEGVLDAFHQTGAKGLLDGTMSGAGAGAAIGSLFGPEGTAIGAAAGAAVGFTVATVGELMDEGNKFGARDYYKKTLEPELEGVRKDWQGGDTGDYLSAISEANKDAGAGMDAMQAKYGKEAADWVNANYLNKELTSVTTEIEREARAGAAYTGRQAAEFHAGGIISGFGDMGTSTNEGYIHAMLGEGVVNTPAMQVHGAAVPMMNSGAGAADMAAHYLSMAGGGAGGGSSVTNHYHTHSYNMLDMKSFKGFLDGGGTEVINKAQNKRVAMYGGDAVA